VELIALAGIDEQRKNWLMPLLAGELHSAYAMTEQGTGSDPKQFTTRAVRDGDEWVIDGRNWFVGNGWRSDFHIVMAESNPDVHPYEGMFMLIVPTSTPGISTRQVRNMDHRPGVSALQP
jgi:acyl-CoA dehydrogenase